MGLEEAAKIVRGSPNDAQERKCSQSECKGEFGKEVEGSIQNFHSQALSLW